MTHPTPTNADDVTVIQADREAAARYAEISFGNRVADLTRSGQSLVQLSEAFARHRIAHQSSGEVERLREALSEIEHAETMQIARHLAKSALAIKGGE